MKNQKSGIQKYRRFPMALAIVSVAAVLSGCGQTAYKEGATGSAGASNGGGVWNNTGGGGGGTPPTPNPTPSGGSTSPDTGTTQKYPFSFTLKGSTGAASTYTVPSSVTTDSVLKITVRAGSPQKLSSTSNWTIGFNCLKLTVSVAGYSETAFVTRDGYTPYTSPADPCYGSVAAHTLDFSGVLRQGSNTVTIKVSEPQYDNCQYTNHPEAAGCNSSGGYYYGGTPFPVYSTHSVGGKLEIETNQLN